MKNNFSKKDIIKDKKRRIKIYLKESLIFSILIVLLNLLSYLFDKDYNLFLTINSFSKNLNITINLLIDFIIAFLISYLFEYFINELYIKKKGKIL